MGWVDIASAWGGGFALARPCRGPKWKAPVLADIGRHHATVLRDEEGYVLEALKKTQVNGQSIDKAVLRDGDRLTLGSTCQFQLGMPVSMSATAKLHLVSGHRFPNGVDAVYLLADSLVLGPDPQVHVEIADLDQPVHLYRCGGRLGIHAAGEFSIDGRPCRDRGMLEPASVVRGKGFSLALEPV